MKIKLLSFLVYLTIAGCSSSSNSPTATINQGAFLDSAVEGISYQTATQSGTTDTNGIFKYIKGETVTFTLYGQSLGQVTGSDTLTPLDLQVSNSNEDYSLNILRLIQTLDADSDPSNGITLNAISGTLNVNLNQTTSDFESDQNTIGFIVANTNSSSLVTEQDALNHFSTTLSNINSNYTINLENKTATSITTVSYCQNNFVMNLTYSFTTTNLTLSGSDTVNSTNLQQDCTNGINTTETFPYNTDNFVLSLGPILTYQELNSVVSGTDSDGRQFTTITSHTPNSNTITVIKKIITDPSISPSIFIGHTFKEIITLN